MGDGTKENPYTREDVLRLIEENGGTAKGLDKINLHCTLSVLAMNAMALAKVKAGQIQEVGITARRIG